MKRRTRACIGGWYRHWWNTIPGTGTPGRVWCARCALTWEHRAIGSTLPDDAQYWGPDR